MRYITLYFQSLCPKIGRCCRILYWTDVRYDSMSGLYSLYLSDGRKSLLTANSQIRSPVLAVDFAGALLASESLSFVIIIIIIIIIKDVIAFFFSPLFSCSCATFAARRISGRSRIYENEKRARSVSRCVGSLRLGMLLEQNICQITAV